MTVASAAIGLRFAIPAYQKWKAMPASARKPWFSRTVGAGSYPGGFEEAMTRKEAALILGIKQSASKKDITKAWKKLMLLNHPDNGGSTFVASKVNEARDFLLSGKQDPLF